MWLIALVALLAVGCASRYSHSRTKLKRLIAAFLALCCAFTLLFVYMGFATKYWLFENHNNCSMTYNNPNYAVKEPVLSKSPKSRSSFSPFRGLLRNDNDYVLSIYEVPSASTLFSKKHVDPSTTPLLYVHGFMGNSNQARSISSDMLLTSNVRDNTDFHYFINSHLPKSIDRNFTFFTVDFGDSLVALSTDETISRSIFLNECIQKIQDMYKEADKKIEKEKMASKAASTSTSSSASSSTPNSNSNSQAGISKSHPLVIVAHSLGGIVARLSFLLSNFPSQKLKCSNTVSDLIMLSSPNVAPPNNYDMNMETLFSQVNSAWRGSFHKDCSNSSKYDVLGNSKGSSSSSNIARGLNENTISVNWNCPPCTAQVRVVSITGGIFDDLVDPELTLLSHMTPAMVNRTYRPKAVNSSNIPTPQRSFFARTVGWMYDLVMMPFRFVFSIIFELFTFCQWVFSCCYAIYAFFVPASVASSNNNTLGIYVNESECAIFNTSDSNATVPFQCLANANLTSFGGDSSNISINEQIDEKQPVCIRKFECDNTTRTRYLDMLYHLSNIDMEELQDTMQPYKEPLHLNIRTSSIFIDKSSAGLKDLLVVDHNAVVWCQELLRYILKGLSVLKAQPKAKNSNKFIFDYYTTDNNGDDKNGLEAFWSDAFPIKFIDPPLDFNFLSSYNCSSSSSSSCDQSSQLVGGAILYNHVHISNFSHPVANFLYRNETDSQWAKMAYVEKSQLFDLLQNSSNVYGLGFLSSIFKYASFMFVSGKAISMILFWYVFISVGVVNYFQFDIFVGNRSSKCPLRVEDFSLPLDDETDISGYFLSSMVLKEMLNLSKLHVLVHSNLRIGLNIVVNAMEETKRVKNGASIATRLMNIFSGIAIIMVLVGFYNYYYYFIDGFLPAISVFACSVSSYFIALVIRSVLHFLTVLVKVLLTVVTDVLRVLSMKIFKSGTYLGDLSLFEIFFGTSKFRNCLFVFSYLALFIFYTSSFTQTGSHLSDGIYYQYMLIFTLFVLLAVLMAYFLFAPVLVSRNCLCKDFYVNSLGKSLYMTDIGLLYLPFLLLLMPTFKLVTGSLFPDMKSHYDDVDILDMFGPNNLSMLFLMCVVCLHLIAVVFAKSVLSFVIKPANYIQLFFLSDSKNSNDVLFLTKLNEIVNDSDEIGQIIENKRERESKVHSEKSNDSDTKRDEVSAAAPAAVVTTLALSCIHENGGRKAVFVKISENEVPENALQSLGRQKYCQEVVLGPTYKVYYCNCASVVPKIEHARDFCEWCRCTQCGGRSGGRGLKPGPSANDGRFKVYLQEEARKKGGKTQDYDDDDNNSNGIGKSSTENSSPFVNFIFDFMIANSSPITYLLCSYWGTQDSLYRFCYVLTVLSSFQLLRMLFVKQPAFTDADLGLKK